MAKSDDGPVKWEDVGYEDGDEEGIVNLNNLVFQEDKDLTRWHWLHKQNPAGHGFIRLAKDNDNIAGHYTIIPLNLRINGKLTLCSQSLDTMTHPDYRGQGIFTKLADRVYDDAAEAGVALVYGFPNEISYPGLIKKLNWFDVCNIPYLVKVLNLDNVLKNKEGNKLKKALIDTFGSLAIKTIYKTKKAPDIKSFEIEEIESFSPEFDGFWKKINDNFSIVIDRSCAHLNWRYVDIPDVEYKIYSGKLNDDIAGYIVLRTMEKDGLKIGYIVDLIGQPGRQDIVQALLTNSIDYFIENQVDKILCWVPKHSDYFKTFKDNGFLFRPSPLKLVARLNGSTLSQAYIADEKNWYFTMGDSDII